MNKLLETINAILETCTGPAEAFVHLEDHKHELMVMQEECDCFLSIWKDAVRGLSSKGPDMMARLGFATFAESRQRLAAALKEADIMSYDAERSYEQMKRQELIVAAIELHIQSRGWEKPLTKEDFVAPPAEIEEVAIVEETARTTVADDTRPIPAGVYWHADNERFYQDQNGVAMSAEFYNEWYDHRFKFPQRYAK